MARYPAALALLLAFAAGASAQELAGMEGLAAQVAGIRAQAQAQRSIPQAPKARKARAMGATGRSEVQELDAAAAPVVGGYQVRGIDVSHHQLVIDWSRVKTAGLSFAYVKATEGADDVDEDFAANWAGAASAGLARGAYHFYNFCKTGSAQAANFIKTVPAGADSLPATVDLEDSADCATMPAKAAFRANLAAFVKAIAAAYGHAPILYVNYAIYDRYFKGENDPYRFWIADTSHAAPEMPDKAAWTMWQYGWHGRVAGIKGETGEVDLDVFNGTPQMLADLASQRDPGAMLALR
jgi:lysozyme